MGCQEYGKCDLCGKEAVISRKYYHYRVECECCNGDRHHHLIRYCVACTPKPPKVITVHGVPVGPER